MLIDLVPLKCDDSDLDALKGSKPAEVKTSKKA